MRNSGIAECGKEANKIKRSTVTIEELISGYADRFELVVTRTGLWSVHDKEEHTYTLGMTMDEARHYLRRQGIDINTVPIYNGTRTD